MVTHEISRTCDALDGAQCPAVSENEKFDLEQLYFELAVLLCKLPWIVLIKPKTASVSGQRQHVVWRDEGSFRRVVNLTLVMALEPSGVRSGVRRRGAMK